MLPEPLGRGAHAAERGGQHRNKRESAVRLKHLPSGIIAQVSLSKSHLASFLIMG